MANAISSPSTAPPIQYTSPKQLGLRFITDPFGLCVLSSIHLVPESGEGIEKNQPALPCASAPAGFTSPCRLTGKYPPYRDSSSSLSPLSTHAQYPLVCKSIFLHGKSRLFRGCGSV